MTLARDRYVAERFDRLEGRFKDLVAEDDPRLSALVDALRPIEGKLLLDLGCGKGRFARRLTDRGATVIGLDISRKMLERADRTPRVLASAASIPFAEKTFDAVYAVEVFEHLDRRGIDVAAREIYRVLRPGGSIAIVDKNAFALDARRPWLPKSVLKRIDERRGLWMYPPRAKVREVWFRPEGFRSILAERFEEARTSTILSKDESSRRIFQMVPAARLFRLWTARRPGGSLG